LIWLIAPDVTEVTGEGVQDDAGVSLAGFDEVSLVVFRQAPEDNDFDMLGEA
jgi:hypothetical protein